MSIQVNKFFSDGKYIANWLVNHYPTYTSDHLHIAARANLILYPAHLRRHMPQTQMLYSTEKDVSFHIGLVSSFTINDLGHTETLNAYLNWPSS